MNRDDIRNKLAEIAREIFDDDTLAVIDRRDDVSRHERERHIAAARETQKPIAFFSLEMTSGELVSRLLSAEAKIDSQSLRRAKIDHAATLRTEGRIGFGDSRQFSLAGRTDHETS